MDDQTKSTQRKSIAVEFLTHLRRGDRASVERLLAHGARHHNPYFAAGMPALLRGAVEAATAFPERSSVVQRVIADGDHVVVHSHVRHRPGEGGVAAVHIFRFDGDRIAGLWDIGQAVPTEGLNADGMF